MPTRHKVYITKQALGNGVLVKFVNDPTSKETPMEVFDNESDISTSSYASINHIHSTKKEALAYAGKMRDSKMASLQKQMRELYAHEIKVIR